MKLLVKFLPIVFPVILVLIFFWQFFLKGLLPIPGDTIVGLYHPYRDLYAKEYPRGIPFKNFLITDPVRQQYPWRFLSIDLLKSGELPLWNPYSFSGTPLLANFQSAVFYPLNIIFFILPFNFAWSLLIILEIFLGSMFMFLYLNNLKLNKWASLLGSLVFSFSGFSIAWLEWGNILHTAIWLPLVLLSIDKSFKDSKLIWKFIFTFSLISSFFAGHLQIFFYLLILSTVYLLYRWVEQGKNKNIMIQFIICYLLFAIVTSIQWIPTLNFIQESARSLDQSDWQRAGWFIPWQHLLQFLVPDFFGNPTTLNYWGVFNYGEFIGYVGVTPLLFALFALFFRRDKITFLLGSIFFVGLIFALPTIFAKLPYSLNIPLMSTAQPTRLLFIVDFSLAVLAALGLDFFLKNKKKIIYPLGFLLVIYSLIWIAIFILLNQNQSGENFYVARNNLFVSKNNLIFPTAIFFILILFIIFFYLKISKKLIPSLVFLLLLLTAFDLFRFAGKFTPFTKSEYLFPSTEIIKFLQKQEGEFRIITNDSRIFAPNFSNIYKIQSLDGYDPLYLQRYGELVAASERGVPNISPPFGFDRIITPHNFESPLINLLGAKYLLTLSDIPNKNFKKVFSEGETRIYENKKVLPRVFFVKETVLSNSKKESIEFLFKNRENLGEVAVVENSKGSTWSPGEARILEYGENRVVIKTENQGDGFLVLTDSFYPMWKVKIDGEKSSIIRTDYNFRGVIVPKGEHITDFYIDLL